MLNLCHTLNKVKVKLSLCACHEGKGGSGGMALLILNFGSKCRQVVSFTSWGKNPWYPLNRMLGGSTTGLDALDKREISYSCWELNHDLSLGVQPVS